MRSQFEYNFQLAPKNNIDIVDIGNCAISATSESDGYEYIIVTQTIMGKTYIAQCGPLVIDKNDEFVNGFNTHLTITEYKEKRIEYLIDTFLNDKGKRITNATEITKEDAINKFQNLKTYLWVIYMSSTGGEKSDKDTIEE